MLGRLQKHDGTEPLTSDGKSEEEQEQVHGSQQLQIQWILPVIRFAELLDCFANLNSECSTLVIGTEQISLQTTCRQGLTVSEFHFYRGSDFLHGKNSAGRRQDKLSSDRPNQILFHCSVHPTAWKSSLFGNQAATDELLRLATMTPPENGQQSCDIGGGAEELQHSRSSPSKVGRGAKRRCLFGEQTSDDEINDARSADEEEHSGSFDGDEDKQPQKGTWSNATEKHRDPIIEAVRREELITPPAKEKPLTTKASLGNQRMAWIVHLGQGTIFQSLFPSGKTPGTWSQIAAFPSKHCFDLRGKEAMAGAEVELSIPGPMQNDCIEMALFSTMACARATASTFSLEARGTTPSAVCDSVNMFRIIYDSRTQTVQRYQVLHQSEFLNDELWARHGYAISDIVKTLEVMPDHLLWQTLLSYGLPVPSTSSFYLADGEHQLTLSQRATAISKISTHLLTIRPDWGARHSVLLFDRTTDKPGTGEKKGQRAGSTNNSTSSNKPVSLGKPKKLPVGSLRSAIKMPLLPVHALVDDAFDNIKENQVYQWRNIFILWRKAETNVMEEEREAANPERPERRSSQMRAQIKMTEKVGKESNRKVQEKYMSRIVPTEWIDPRFRSAYEPVEPGSVITRRWNSVPLSCLDEAFLFVRAVSLDHEQTSTNVFGSKT